MELQPMFNKVVVRRDEAAEKSKGGILLPDTAKDTPRRGTVMAVGPSIGYFRNGEKRLEKEHLLKKGDKVMFAAYGGSEVDVDGSKLLILDETEILAVVRG